MVPRWLLTTLLLLASAACADGADVPSAASSNPSQAAGSGPPVAADYRVEPSLFAPVEDVGTRESLMVVGADQGKVVAALKAAGRRWLYVTEDGEDLSHLAPDTDALVEAAADRYTPNYVFDVYLAARGPALLVDCKGAVPPPMAQTFIDIVIEELRRAGVLSATLEDAGEFTGQEPILAEL